jgi:hypothetical protein
MRMATRLCDAMLNGCCEKSARFTQEILVSRNACPGRSLEVHERISKFGLISKCLF